MKSSLAILSAIVLLVPAMVAAQGVQPKSVSRKTTTAAKTTAPAPRPVDPAKKLYAEFTITELVAEDPSRWSEKMSTRITLGGFVTQISKEDSGDTDIRICENPKIDGMDRGRCIIAKCIPKLPCDVPQVGRPVNVKGITRYDAGVGAHWWEIHPIEEIEK